MTSALGGRVTSEPPALTRPVPGLAKLGMRWSMPVTREDARTAAVQTTSSRAHRRRPAARSWARAGRLSPGRVENCAGAVHHRVLLRARLLEQGRPQPGRIGDLDLLGASTTGTSLTTSTGKLASGICVTSCGRNSAAGAAGRTPAGIRLPLVYGWPEASRISGTQQAEVPAQGAGHRRCSLTAALIRSGHYQHRGPG